MNHFIEQNISEIATTVKHSSYIVTSGMMLSSVFDFINNNVGVIGFLGFVATWFLNRHLGNKKLILEDKWRQKDYDAEEIWREKNYKLKAENLQRRNGDKPIVTDDVETTPTTQ